MIYTYRQFAELVQKLRAVQKSDGSGYKNAASKSASKPLEAEVDKVAAEVVKFWPFDEKAKTNG